MAVRRRVWWGRPGGCPRAGGAWAVADVQLIDQNGNGVELVVRVRRVSHGGQIRSTGRRFWSDEWIVREGWDKNAAAGEGFDATVAGSRAGCFGMLGVWSWSCAAGGNPR